MTPEIIEKIVTAIVFIFGLAGVYYRMKSKIEKNSEDIKSLKDSEIRHSAKMDLISDSLSDLKVISEQVKVIFNMLNSQSETIEKNQDRVAGLIEKLFDKLESKKDKD